MIHKTHSLDATYCRHQLNAKRATEWIFLVGRFKRVSEMNQNPSRCCERAAVIKFSGSCVESVLTTVKYRDSHGSWSCGEGCVTISGQDSVIRAATTIFKPAFLFDLLLRPYKIPLNSSLEEEEGCAIHMVIFWRWSKWLVNSAFTQVTNITRYYHCRAIASWKNINIHSHVTHLLLVMQKWPWWNRWKSNLVVYIVKLLLFHNCKWDDN